MTSLGNLSADEIRNMLDEYGIKHGPVVASTRSLYEKKLREAMSKGTKAKPTSDKTYYREEEDEVTYVYRAPVRNDGAGDREPYLRSRPEWTEQQSQHKSSYSSYSQPRPDYRGREYVDGSYAYESPSTYQQSYVKATPKEKAPNPPKSARLVPMWVQVLVFLMLAVFLYMVFSSMETNESFRLE